MRSESRAERVIFSNSHQINSQALLVSDNDNYRCLYPKCFASYGQKLEVNSIKTYLASRQIPNNKFILIDFFKIDDAIMLIEYSALHYPEIPRIVFSTSTDALDIMEWKVYGASDAITLPVYGDDLGNLIKKWNKLPMNKWRE